MRTLSIQSVAKPPKPAKSFNAWVKFHLHKNKILVSAKSKDQQYTPQF